MTDRPPINPYDIARRYKIAVRKMMTILKELDVPFYSRENVENPLLLKALYKLDAGKFDSTFYTIYAKFWHRYTGLGDDDAENLLADIYSMLTEAKKEPLNPLGLNTIARDCEPLCTPSTLIDKALSEDLSAISEGMASDRIAKWIKSLLRTHGKQVDQNFVAVRLLFNIPDDELIRWEKGKKSYPQKVSALLNKLVHHGALDGYMTKIQRDSLSQDGKPKPCNVFHPPDHDL